MSLPCGQTRVPLEPARAGVAARVPARAPGNPKAFRRRSCIFVTLTRFPSYLSALLLIEPQVLAQDVDLMNPPAEYEARKHKLKRLVQSPNSFFMDVKCQGCFNITTVFSHSQTVVLCGSCSAVLCQPTGGKARLTEGCSFRPKVQ
jgi:small subunit ribosomal protein S27e